MRMTRFLANITDMTRLESGEIAPRLAPVQVGELVDAAVSRLRRPAEIRTTLPDDLPPVSSDPALLEQALFNVLDNAVKYAHGLPRISIGAVARDGRILLRIEDRGIGIAPLDLPHVFDSFYRARFGDRVAAGTGLGLAIARGLIEAMGGRITAVSPREDAPGGEPPGTVVTLDLPAAPTGRRT